MIKYVQRAENHRFFATLPVILHIYGARLRNANKEEKNEK